MEKLNTDYCKNVKISINTPINLSDQTISLYNSLNQSGYNLFDSNDSFYTDVCTTYTSENGTDVIISDRQNMLYTPNNNISLCQDNCTFESYNNITKKVKCNCDVQKYSNETDFSKINFNNNIIVSTFLVSIKNSNIMVLKCYQYAIEFELPSLLKNIGRIIMIVFFFIFLVLLFFFLIKDGKNIGRYISEVIQNKAHIIEYNKNINKTLNNKKEQKKTKLKNKPDIKRPKKIDVKNLKKNIQKVEDKKKNNKDKNKKNIKKNPPKKIKGKNKSFNELKVNNNKSSQIFLNNYSKNK